MKKFLLACVAFAIVACFAVQASAQETNKSPGTTITKSSEVQISPTPRTGPLRRLGDRRDNGAVTIVTPSTTTKVETTTPVTPPVAATTSAQVNETRTGRLARLRGRLGR